MKNQITREELIEILNDPTRQKRDKYNRLDVEATLEYNKYDSSDMSGLDLSNMDLSNAEFCGIDLKGTKFIRSNLQKSSFSMAFLEGTDFTEANLTKASIFEANFSNAIFTGANLYEVQTNNEYILELQKQQAKNIIEKFSHEFSLDRISQIDTNTSNTSFNDEEITWAEKILNPPKPEQKKGKDSGCIIS